MTDTEVNMFSDEGEIDMTDATQAKHRLRHGASTRRSAPSLVSTRMPSESGTMASRSHDQGCRRAGTDLDFDADELLQDPTSEADELLEDVVKAGRPSRNWSPGPSEQQRFCENPCFGGFLLSRGTTDVLALFPEDDAEDGRGGFMMDMSLSGLSFDDVGSGEDAGVCGTDIAFDFLSVGALEVDNTHFAAPDRLRARCVSGDGLPEMSALGGGEGFAVAFGGAATPVATPVEASEETSESPSPTPARATPSPPPGRPRNTYSRRFVAERPSPTSTPEPTPEPTPQPTEEAADSTPPTLGSSESSDGMAGSAAVALLRVRRLCR